MRAPDELRAALEARFERPAREARAFFAPGRVNLIGEHTDYNDGFVLPVTLELGITVLAAPRDDRRVRVHSLDLDRLEVFDLDQPGSGKTGRFVDYVEGVAQSLEAGGDPLRGADLVVAGDLPHGAGLSSSAALEIAAGFALVSLAGRPVDRAALALAGQRAEHDWVGTRCGIMDQLASARGRAGHALLLDCRTLEVRDVPLPRAPVAILVADTQKKHELASSEYNTRREECERAVHILQSELPGIRALRDIDTETLVRLSSRLPDSVMRRARHVVTENARTLQAASALERGDLAAVGALFVASHRSLQHDYEVSCPELDALVDLAIAEPGVHGARMTGGGFGGSTLTLVDESALEAVVRAIREPYERRFGVAPRFFVTRGGEGARELEG